MRIFLMFFVLFFCFQADTFGRDVSYTIDGEEFEGFFLAGNAGRPLVILVHDWDGVTDYEKKRAGMLAEQGYQVFVLDLFGKGVRPVLRDEKKQLTGALYADRTRMRKLLNGGLDAARSLGGNVENAVSAGYCFGGAAVLEWARSGVGLKGFVSFHGGLTTPEEQDYTSVQSNILVFHGTADSAVTMDEFAELAEALEQDGVRHEMITYSGAPHAFTVFGSERYRKDADEKSWRRFQEYLADVLFQGKRE